MNHSVPHEGCPRAHTSLRFARSESTRCGNAGRGAQQAGAAPQDTESPTDRRFLGLVSVTPEFHVYACAATSSDALVPCPCDAAALQARVVMMGSGR